MKFGSFSMLFLTFWLFSINALFGQVYVVNRGTPIGVNDSVSVINVTNNDVIATIPVEDRPVAVSITPNGTKAFVVNSISNTVSAIDVASNTITATIPVGDNPLAIAITPDGNKAFVANFFTNEVSVIDVTSNSVTTNIPVGIQPIAIAITPDGTKAFIANSTSNEVSVIDVINNSFITNIPIGIQPAAIIITPDGTKAFVADSISNEVSVIDVASNSFITNISVGVGPTAIAITSNGNKVLVTNINSNEVSVIDVADNSVTTTISVGTNPRAIAITPNNTKAFIVNTNSDDVSVIDMASNNVITAISVGMTPIAIAITPDGTKAFVANSASDNVSVIDVATNSVIATSDVGDLPTSVAIKPDQAPTALFSASVAPAGSSSTFDASASFSPVGSIINYVWDFGDGNTFSTSQPITSHIYAMPANYTVTLTVTNSAGTSTKQIFNSSSSFSTLGVNYIAITNNGGPSARSMQVINVPALPIITEINPSFGPISGGTIVTITGFNFTGATAVFFGTASAASFIVNSDTQITAVSPPHAASTVDIIVQTASGASTLSPAGQFTYQLISTTITLTVSPNPAKRRQTVTLISTVSPFSATGSVIFYSNNKLLGVARVSDGQAILMTRFPHHGKQLIVAAYSGDNQFSCSISNVVVLNIGKSHISPPRHLSASQRINSFHVVNILKWDAPQQDNTIVAYHIYRENLNNQIGTVTRLQHLRFKDRHVKAGKAYTYFIVSVDQDGNVSSPTKIVVRAAF